MLYLLPGRRANILSVLYLIWSFNMAQQQFAPKYRNNITHTRVMSLWGKNEEGTVASFNLYITGNVLHLTVYTGLNEDKQKRQSRIKFDFKDGQLVSFLTVLDTLLSMQDIPLEGKKISSSAAIHGYIKTQSMSKAERRELGKVIVGRDDKGIYYITAINNTHGKVKFNFELDRDIVLYDINSQDPLPREEASRRVMVSFVNNAKLIIANVLTQEYVDKEANEGKSNNNYNRSDQSNNQSSQSGNNQAANPDNSDSEDDFFM